VRALVLALALVPLLAAPAFASLESDVANAAGAGDYARVKALTEAGANLNVRDEEGYTPLIWAAQHGNTRVADYLIAHGANLNPLDKGGYTPLMWACQEGHFSMVALLLTKGANPWVRNWHGQTAMELAAMYSHDERIRDLFAKYQAKPPVAAAARPPAPGTAIAFNAPSMAGWKPNMGPMPSMPAPGSAPASGGAPSSGGAPMAGNPAALPVNGLAGTPGANNPVMGLAGTPGAAAPRPEIGGIAKVAALGKLAQVGAKATQMSTDFVKANITNPLALLDPDLLLAKDIGQAYIELARDQNLMNFKTSWDKVTASWGNRTGSKFTGTITETNQILKEAGL